jgi:hypothetical protein
LVWLWHEYRSEILSRLSDQRKCGGLRRLVEEVYREIFLVSMPLALFAAGALPTSVQKLHLAYMTPYLQAAAAAYFVVAFLVALHWFHRV